jgi:hypothetical protein
MIWMRLSALTLPVVQRAWMEKGSQERPAQAAGPRQGRTEAERVTITQRIEVAGGTVTSRRASWPSWR